LLFQPTLLCKFGTPRIYDFLDYLTCCKCSSPEGRSSRPSCSLLHFCCSASVKGSSAFFYCPLTVKLWTKTACYDHLASLHSRVFKKIICGYILFLQRSSSTNTYARADSFSGSSQKCDDKTELVLIGHPKRLAKIHDFELSVGINNVKPSPCARNLGCTSTVLYPSNRLFRRLCSEEFVRRTFHFISFQCSITSILHKLEIPSH